MFFPNSEILFDFNAGSSRVFKDHLMFYLVRGALPRIVATRPSTWYLQYLVNLTFKTPHEIDKNHGILHFSREVLQFLGPDELR